MIICLIVAVDSKDGIAKEGRIPWKCIEDIKYFKDITMGHAVVMGRKTYESIGNVLVGRKNYIVSRGMYPVKFATIITADTKSSNNSEQIKNIYDLVRKYKHSKDRLFVIGGAKLYNLFITNDYVDLFYITIINGVYNCDTRFPIPVHNIINNTKYSSMKSAIKTSIGYIEFYTILTHQPKRINTCQKNRSNINLHNATSTSNLSNTNANGINNIISNIKNGNTINSSGNSKIDNATIASNNIGAIISYK